MKYRLFALITILAVLAGVFGLPTPAKAVSYGAKFTTSVTYMNIDTAEAEVSMLFYAEGSSTAITWTAPAKLPVHAASSLYAGSVFSSAFSGSAVVSSSAMLAVTAVQTSTTIKNRMLSNGFSAGSPNFTIPTVLKNTFNNNSVFAIQNADTDAADITVTFNPVSGSPWSESITNLPAGAAKVYDMGSYALPGGATAFNGSVSISAKKAGTSTDGAVVATSQEFNIANDNVYAFEGVPSNSGGSTLYMPSAQCKYGTNLVDSSYAVMNAGTDTINVSVAYSSGATDTTGTTPLEPGKKVSFGACNVNSTGYSGSAVITATHASGSGSPTIVGIGKLFNGGVSTAFTGITTGSQKVALPYVRFSYAGWANSSKQRVFIAIQNVSGSGSTALPIGSVVVTFYDVNGNSVGTLSNTVALNNGDKFSVSAKDLGAVGSEFGYGTTTGGGAVIEGPAGSKLAVIARAQTYITATTTTGEDYNGIPIP